MNALKISYVSHHRSFEIFAATGFNAPNGLSVQHNVPMAIPQPSRFQALSVWFWNWLIKLLLVLGTLYKVSLGIKTLNLILAQYIPLIPLLAVHLSHFF